MSQYYKIFLYIQNTTTTGGKYNNKTTAAALLASDLWLADRIGYRIDIRYPFFIVYCVLILLLTLQRQCIAVKRKIAHEPLI